MSDQENTAKKQITLLFSGGVDSTMAACQLAELFEKVHLVSYSNGYGHYLISRTAKRAKELSRHYPGKFQHSIISIRELFESLVIDTLDEDYAKNGSGFIWCMGCKLAMHMHTIIYNTENDIHMAADGSSFDTSEMVEQMPLSVAKIKGFYCEYGITFDNPVYKKKRQDSIKALKTMGFKMGLQIGDRFLGVQPKCKPGELYYMPLLLRGTPPNHQEKMIGTYIDAKIEWARDYLNKNLGEKKSVG
jgi:predicted subunit of tRNA(5-methylaminomethyl-2-thiouridylate) methyltransferase